jgi:hypothetical protein
MLLLPVLSVLNIYVGWAGSGVPAGNEFSCGAVVNILLTLLFDLHDSPPQIFDRLLADHVPICVQTGCWMLEHARLELFLARSHGLFWLFGLRPGKFLPVDWLFWFLLLLLFRCFLGHCDLVHCQVEIVFLWLIFSFVLELGGKLAHVG